MDDHDIMIPADIAQAALDYTRRQDAARGDWPNPRTGAHQPDPPFPATDNPMLKLLLAQFEAQINAGRDIHLVALHLAVHAWYEGHIEGYDRGHHDVATPT